MAVELAPRRRWRAAIGFTLAALIGALPFGALVYVTDQSASDLKLGNSATVFLVLAIGNLLLMLVFGWPFHAWARRLKWRRFTTYLSASALLGLIGAILIYAVYARSQHEGVEGDAAFTAGYATGVFVGAGLVAIIPMLLMATTFWLVRRPDRDARGVAPLFE